MPSFLFMLIESQKFVISNILLRVKSEDSAFLALVFIPEAFEIVGCNFFECKRDDLGKRLSW